MFNDEFAWIPHKGNNFFGPVFEGELCNEFINGNCMYGCLCQKYHFLDVGTSSKDVYAVKKFYRPFKLQDRRFCHVKYLENWKKKDFTLWCDPACMEGTLRILQGELSDGRRVEELGVMQFINHFDIKLLKIPLIRNLETIVQSGTICQEMVEEVFNREKQPFAVDDSIFGLIS